MGRLIDENEFYARVLEGRKFVWQMHDLPRQEIVVQTVYEDLADFVRTIPTAYDVEAVVRELEAKSTFYAHEAEGDKDMGYEYLTIRKYGISDGLDIAIEIVKKRWTG